MWSVHAVVLLSISANYASILPPWKLHFYFFFLAKCFSTRCFLPCSLPPDLVTFHLNLAALKSIRLAGAYWVKVVKPTHREQEECNEISIECSCFMDVTGCQRVMQIFGRARPSRELLIQWPLCTPASHMDSCTSACKCCVRKDDSGRKVGLWLPWRYPVIIGCVRIYSLQLFLFVKGTHAGDKCNYVRARCALAGHAVPRCFRAGLERGRVRGPAHR